MVKPNAAEAASAAGNEGQYAQGVIELSIGAEFVS